jgi:hypothetical protein
VNIRDDNANRRIEMTVNSTTTSTARAVAEHDCADHGCLAAMLGLAPGDATPVNAEGGSASGW